MDPMSAVLAAGAATRIISSLAPRPACDPGFAELLRSHVEDLELAGDLTGIEAFAERLSGLPLTSSEAREVACELQSLLADLEQTGSGTTLGARLNRAMEDFVARISERFLLSGEDSTRLANLVYEEAGRQIGEAVGTNSIESTA